MFQSLRNMMGQRSPQRAPMMAEPSSPTRSKPAPDRQTSYARVFRWRLPDGQTKEPVTVEIAGSFNHWQRVPLQRDSVLDAWHITLHHIPGNRTHHYMLFVDGQPAPDKTCDGLAVPHGPQEEQFALATEKGPRVFMLFAQTK